VAVIESLTDKSDLYDVMARSDLHIPKEVFEKTSILPVERCAAFGL
jgi:hypothetical protein